MNPIFQPKAARGTALARALLLFGVSLAALPAAADTLHLRNGRVLTGRIEESASTPERISINIAGTIVQIPRENIERIERRAVTAAELEGDRALATGRLEQARDWYHSAVRDAPEDPVPAEKLADLTRRMEEESRRRYGDALAGIEQAMDAGRFEQAITQAEQLAPTLEEPAAAARLRRLRSRAHVGRARQFRDRVQYDQAEIQFRLAMQVDPSDPIPPFELAQVLQGAPARRASAIPLFVSGFERVAAAGGDPALTTETLLAYRARLAELYSGTGDFEGAARTIVELVRREPVQLTEERLVMALDALEKLAARPEPPAEMLEWLGTLRSLLPAEPRVAYLHGRALEREARDDEAIEAYGVALKGTEGEPLSPLRQSVTRTLADLHVRHGRLAPAAELLEALVVAGVENYDLYTRLAEIQRDQARFERALELDQLALALSPDPYRAHLGRARTLALMARFEEARAGFRDTLARDKGSLAARLGLAQTWFDEQRYREALTEAERLLAEILDPEGGVEATPAERKDAQLRLLMMIGDSHRFLGEFNTARIHYGRALAVEARHVPALRGMALAFQSQGVPDDAERYLLDAQAADPENPELALQLGIHFQKYLQQPQKALTWYRKYYELGGADPVVREWISEVGGAPPPAGAR